MVESILLLSIHYVVIKWWMLIFTLTNEIDCNINCVSDSEKHHCSPSLRAR